ncbi:hypothetical protein M422DRAFT_265772 [Sphaerobolus stellatus SS14]|uniref:Unplaced genomic scaffold SPHSTscaffold_152, whole genome shotgun sequence n=1 Tax=Sphaerobolus stellatus (strain SS14) TaxID=990650 RepID=A0A0C9TQP4_SPHS4|nr:hypothetical protein M422DRAFT_265772 [Sphaerobolus stellatus SS14]
MYIILSTFACLIFIVVFPVILYLKCCIGKSHKRYVAQQTSQTLEEIKRILDPPGVPLSIQLRMRAIPNTRLIKAFGISQSTFTSASTEIHRDFRVGASRKVKDIDFRRNSFAYRDKLKEIIDHYLSISSEKAPQDFSQFTQTVVFVTVLTIFFDLSGPLPNHSDIRFITQWINTQWVSSKDSDFEGNNTDHQAVIGILRRFIPDSLEDRFNRNPLELILPAYETMWRLVAHAIISILPPSSNLT